MATIPLTQPYSLKSATLSIGADDFTAAIGGVTFTPTTSTASWRGVGGNVVSEASAPVWACKIDFAQDLSEEGLTRYLVEHAGETVLVTFIPKQGGNITITATITLVPGPIGGTAQTAGILTSSTTCPVTGTPSIEF